MANPPTMLGPYELVARLGAGGMAETFVGVRRGPGGFEQRVCVKRILPAFEGDSAFVRQFLQEARVSAGLRHANIAQVLDFGLSEGSHYLVLELIEGMDLARLLRVLHERGDTLTSGLVSFLASELGTALHYAHHHASGAVVHRDISPSNVLVSRAGEIKLTDFGIAKAASQSSDAPKTSTGTIKGKVPYMAAEYALSGRFEPRSDLFALGVLLYEALAGRRPFIGNTELDTLHRIMKGEHPSLLQLCPGAPPILVAAIEKLLRPDPEERFATAADLLDALIDVAPPPTARRILGDLVHRCSLDQPASAPVAPVEGTVPISDAARERLLRDPVPVAASPHEPTRTRLPSGSPPPLDAPRPIDPSLPRTAISSLETAPTRAAPRASGDVTPVPAATPRFHDTPVPGAAPRSYDTPIPGATPRSYDTPIPGATPRSYDTPIPGAAPRSYDTPITPATPHALETARPAAPARAPLRRAAFVSLGMAAAGAITIGVALAASSAWSTAADGGAAPIVQSPAPIMPPPTLPAQAAAPSPLPTSPSAPARTPPPTPAEPAPSEPPREEQPSAAVSPRARDAPHPRHRGRPDAGVAVALVQRPPEVATTPPRADPPAAAEPEPEPTRAASPTTAQPARLLVTVAPWGNVWIDGRFMGRSPIDVPLPPGAHRVAAGSARPGPARTVRLRAGHTETLDLELAAPSD